MPSLSVTADDRTGALEVAAFIANAGAPTLVSVFPDVSGSVVDLGSRALDEQSAAARAGGVRCADWDAHKIDSTLRGNWAVEVRARAGATCRAAVLVPAWPAMGRTCRGGVVHAAGRLVGDVGQHLQGVDVLDGAVALAGWLRSAQGDASGVATVDVVDDDDLGDVAAVLRDADVLVAGPAGAIGAVHAARVPGRAAAAVPLTRTRADSILVVSGSATVLARRQVEALRLSHPVIEVVAASGDVHDGALDPVVSVEVAERATRLSAGRSAVVVVGGDTAAAFLGGDCRWVGGFALPGMPWSLDADGGGPLVITKAGGFGGERALVELVDLLMG